MNISAVNCTPIKPQVAFKEQKVDYEKLHTLATDLDNQSVNPHDVKKPIAVLLSLAALAGVSYAGGVKAAKGASILYEKISNVISKFKGEVAEGTKEVAQKAQLGEVIESGLKKLYSIADFGIEKLRTVPSEEVTVLTKKQMNRNAIPSLLKSGLEFAKNIYKKVAYGLIPKGVDGAERAQKAFENVAGAVGLATVFPAIARRDADGDGVKDIMQKSQNAYTAKAEQSREIISNMGLIGDVIESLT